MYTGARLPWGSLNQNAGWLGDDSRARGTSRMATTGKRPLPWGTVNPGGYLGADPVDWTAVINQGLSTVGSIFGGHQNQSQTPASGISYPVSYAAPAQAGLFGGISTPVVLGVAALAAVLLLKRR